MHCEYFGICGSCTLYTLGYEEQVEQKVTFLEELFADIPTPKLEVFTSPSEHYRNRAEFKIWHDGSNISYAMGRLDKSGVVKIESCPKVVEPIYELFVPLKRLIEDNVMLREKLFAIEFLAGDDRVLISMLYHKKLDQSWDNSAKVLEDRLGVSIIGRSRKVKRTLSVDCVHSRLHVGTQSLVYKIIEGSFSQPNNFVNAKMIAWVCAHIKEPKDLLELYCGHGNFTIALAKYFQRVLATEISKTSIHAAKDNCELNAINNIEFLRMGVEELTSAFNKEREFFRLKDIDLCSYDFSHVFVDPPRSGIDEKSLAFIAKFDTIIYISCNPLSLRRDIERLNGQFEIQDFALFDQFANTMHAEAGVILKKL